jgi:hypothetical protein
MRILQTIAIIALACIAAAQTSEKLSLARQFKEGASHKYRIVAKFGQDGQDAEIKGVVEAKTKTTKEGKAQTDFKCSDFSQIVNGSQGSEEAPAGLTTALDKHNMPEALIVRDGGSMYVALAVASFLPGKEVAKGESFKIDWKGKDDGGSIVGKGSVIEIKTVGEIKIAVVKSNVEVTPANESQPAVLEITSEFNMADGTLIKSSAKGNLPEGAIAFTVELVK